MSGIWPSVGLLPMRITQWFGFMSVDGIRSASVSNLFLRQCEVRSTLYFRFASLVISCHRLS